MVLVVEKVKKRFRRSTNGLAAGDFKEQSAPRYYKLPAAVIWPKDLLSVMQNKPNLALAVISTPTILAISPSSGAYDRKVAGVVSGAGDVQPGLDIASRRRIRR